MRKKRPSAHALKGGPLRIRWSAFPPFIDEQGNELRRPFKLESLAAAIEGALTGSTPFMLRAFERVRSGSARLQGITFELAQESEQRVVFRALLSFGKGANASARVVASKQPGKLSEALNEERQRLERHYAQAPGFVLRPLGGGPLYLPAPRQRKDAPRVTYAYITGDAPAHVPLAPHESGQFLLLGDKPQLLSHAVSEAIREELVEAWAGTFEEEQGRCMGMPDSREGSLLAYLPRGKAPSLRIAVAPKPRTRLTPARFIQYVGGAMWPSAGAAVPLAPESLHAWFRALTRASDRSTAGQWLASYVRGVDAGGIRPRRDFGWTTEDVAGLRGL